MMLQMTVERHYNLVCWNLTTGCYINLTSANRDLFLCHPACLIAYLNIMYGEKFDNVHACIHTCTCIILRWWGF